MKDTISAVVVAHNPDGGFPRRVVQLHEQVACVVLVDNGSQARVAEQIEALKSPEIVVIRNAQNLGVATALNQGVMRARERGAEYVLLLDQDTVPAGNMVAELVAIYRCSQSGRTVGLVGSNYRDVNTGREGFRGSRGCATPYTEPTTVITSGTLLSIDAYNHVGPFRDDLFIDQVDHEYCLRLRSRGHRVLMSRAPLMDHSIGRGRLVGLLGKALVCLNEPPLRKYYATRNRLILFRTYMFREPRWTLIEIARVYKEIVLIILFEEAKLRKLTAIVLGIWHFLKGRTGPLSERLSRRLEGSA